MVSFQTQNPNLGKFWRALDWKMLMYFVPVWNILHTAGIFYDHLVHFVFIWYIFPVWVIFTEKNLATLAALPLNIQSRGTEVEPIARSIQPDFDSRTQKLLIVAYCMTTRLLSRVARFCCHKIPKQWKIYRSATKLSNCHNTYQMA
jgi:hypothetical protein